MTSRTSLKPLISQFLIPYKAQNRLKIKIFMQCKNKILTMGKAYTCCQVGKAFLSVAKALSELSSVVFWDRMVFTNPSKTHSLSSASSSSIKGSIFAEFSSWDFVLNLWLRYFTNSWGKPWRDKRSSRTERHSSGVGREWSGNGLWPAPLFPVVLGDSAEDCRWGCFLLRIFFFCI